MFCFVFCFLFFFFKRSFLYRPDFTFHLKWPIFASTPSIVQYRPVFWAVQFKSVSVPFYPSEQVNLAGTVLTSLYGTQTWYIFNRPLGPTQQDWMIIKRIKYINISLAITTKKKKKTLEKIVWKRFWKRLENGLLPQN